MRTRLNRSLSSVKSLAPCFMPLRVRHTSAYDFTCRHCGEVLQTEKEVFAVLEQMFKDINAATSHAQPIGTDLVKPEALKDVLAELNGLRTAQEGSL